MALTFYLLARELLTQFKIPFRAMYRISRGSILPSSVPGLFHLRVHALLLRSVVPIPICDVLPRPRSDVVSNDSAFGTLLQRVGQADRLAISGLRELFHGVRALFIGMSSRITVFCFHLLGTSADS